MGERKLCYGCMERTEFSGGVCPNCGYYDKSPSDPSFIIPGTQLNNRYIVGVALFVNGEGITYLAYDQSIGCKVYLREYMPPNLCNRVAGSPVISVIPARLAQYKALMAEFTELHKSLARLRGQVHVNTVVDLFAENNTTYVVDEYVSSVRFVDYLKDNAGELTWGQLSRMLPPLLTTLSLLHNSGVVHRAISPDTIYVTDKGDLLLTAFSIAAVRTANSELECEIYNGYGGEIKISYEYENKSSLELFTPQRYQEGQWESFGAVGENTVRMETTGTGMKIRITDGWDYPVDEARITLICLGNGNYTRQIDFLFPKDGKEGAKYAQEMLKKKDAGLEITQLEDEEHLVCRVSFSGTAEEISEKVKMLFGPGNSFSYQSQGQGVDLNQEVSIIDNIQMGRLFQGEHQGVPVTYTVQTNGKESLTSLHYEGESRNRDIKIVNGSVIESFQLDGGNGRVVYNGTEPRFWGVVFYFTIAVLVVAGVVTLIVFLRRRAIREGKSTKGVLSQLAEKKELPGETPEEARESVEDILSKL